VDRPRARPPIGYRLASGTGSGWWEQTRVTRRGGSEIKEPFTASHKDRNPEVEQARDAGTTKIANGEQKAEPGLLKALNAEPQAVLDLPRP
jgi:hypothetical protein